MEEVTTPLRRRGGIETYIYRHTYREGEGEGRDTDIQHNI